MSNPIEAYLDNLKPILSVVDEILDNWKGDGCFQLPNLIGLVAVKFSWDEIQIRNHDPIIRSYIRQHPVWYVTRGAGGGIMRRSEYQKKEATKLAKEKAKADIKAALAIKLAQQSASTASAVEDNTNTVSQE